MKNLAESFSRIFAGLARSGGRYVVPNDAKPDSHGKILGRAWTAHTPITLDLWEAHLSGRQITVTDEEKGTPITGALGLGVVPIREDATCVFGAIDIDQYDPPIDFNVLLARVKALKLPVIICRSKSGSAHVYLFLTTPATAEIVRERLMEWAVAMNHPGVEVFPKQTKLSSVRDDGSWINTPYAGGNRSVRYGLKPNGKAMTVEEFVEAVDKIAISPEDLESFELPPDNVTDDRFLESPPCLQTLARTGFGDWQNNGLYNIAVYLKQRFSDDWESRMQEYSDSLKLGLDSKAVTTVSKSVKKKEYFYKCKDQPISAVCNRAVCLKRQFGIGGATGDSGVVFGEMTKLETDPVIWIWDIDGARLETDTATLMDQRKFRALAIEKLSKWPNQIKPEEWTKIVRERLARAVVVKVPEDGTREGQFWAHLANFCTGRARARELDEILMGKAWTDPSVARVYFRSTDFFAYLAAHRFMGVSEREGWRFLRHRGAEHHEKVIKGKFINYWSVPSFPEQTEEHTVPRAAVVEM